MIAITGATGTISKVSMDLPNLTGEAATSFERFVQAALIKADRI